MAALDILYFALGVVLLPPVALGVFIASRKVIGGQRGAILVLAFAAIVLVDLVFRQREYSDKSLDLQVLLKFGSWAALCLLGLTRIHTYIRVVSVSGSALCWIIFLMWCSVSSVYSPNPLYSAAASFSLLAIYFGFFGIQLSCSEDDLVATAFCALAVITTLSLIVYFVFPELGRMKEWEGSSQVIGSRLSGVAGNPNSVGRIAALVVLFATVHWKKLTVRFGGPLCTLGVVVGLGALVLSQSRTAMLALLVLVLYNRKIPKAALVLAMVIVGVVLAAAPFITLEKHFPLDLVTRSKSINELTSLTNRSAIWSIVLALIDEHFWMGWGYASGIFVIPKYILFVGQIAPHAHNIALQLWFTTGLIGLGLGSIAIFLSVWDAYSVGDRFALSMLYFALLDGVTEASAFGGIANITTVVLFWAVTLGHVRAIKVHREDNRLTMYREGNRLTVPR